MVNHITILIVLHDLKHIDMSLKFSQIRAGLATQILTISGMRQARHLPDYFGRLQDTVAHKAFTIEIGIVNQRQDERQRTQIGAYVQTTVIVKFAYRMRPLDVYPTDYDNSLNLEYEIIDKCLQSYATIQPKMQIRFNNSDRQSTNSNEYVIHTIEFIVLHTIKED